MHLLMFLFYGLCAILTVRAILNTPESPNHRPGARLLPPERSDSSFPCECRDRDIDTELAEACQNARLRNARIIRTRHVAVILLGSKNCEGNGWRIHGPIFPIST